MIIDSFPFNNELDLLRIRLEELKDVVDYHILIECSRTQSRLKKPFYYRENKHLFEDFQDKIIDVQLEEYVKGGEANWGQEKFVRQSIVDGLNELRSKKDTELYLNDFLIVSDLDEIPMAESIGKVVQSNPSMPISLNHRFISYFYNLHCPHRGWWGSVVTNLENVRNGWTPQALRDQKDHVAHLGEWDQEFHGWHFSSLCHFDGLWEKWHNNIEPHDKSFLKEEGAKEKHRELFNKAVVGEKRFFYCDQPERNDIKLEILETDKLPVYLQNNLEKYKDLILK